MKVNIAGYNIERELIETLERDGQPPSPETISAAYARISRSGRSVEELRREARAELEAARRSNQSIVFEMGHHSIAEHAVFNIDISGISRLATEALEHHRLNAYTEKSQRYVSLDDDYHVPSELKGTEDEALFHDIIRVQNRYYHVLKDRLCECMARRCPELADRPADLDHATREDARYITSLATTTQLGMTVNARNLELMVRRMLAHPLAEVRELGEELLRAAEAITPSLLVFTGATEFERATYTRLREFAESFMAPAFTRRPKNFIVYSAADVSLVDYSPNADNKLLAALLHSVSRASYAECYNRIERQMLARKREILKLALRDLQAYDAVLREFEHLYVSYELVISASCFAQLKRHRMTSITAQRYNPNVGWTIPESVAEVKEHKSFKDLLARTEEVYVRLAEHYPAAAQYVLTNAHQRRVLVTLNARELYHLSRLREDATAQWDIRDIVNRMVEQARNVMPLTLTLAGGKDDYSRVYQDLFGEPPVVTNLVLPGVRRRDKAPAEAPRVETRIESDEKPAAEAVPEEPVVPVPETESMTGPPEVEEQVPKQEPDLFAPVRTAAAKEAEKPTTGPVSASAKPVRKPARSKKVAPAGGKAAKSGEESSSNSVSGEVKKPVKRRSARKPAESGTGEVTRTTAKSAQKDSASGGRTAKSRKKR